MPADQTLAKLLQLVVPAIGSLAGTTTQRGGFLHGYMQGGELARQHQIQDQERQQRQNEVGANFLMEVGKVAQTYTDPLELHTFLQTAQDAATQAGFTIPGPPLTQRFSVSPTRQSQVQMAQVAGELQRHAKNGYDLDALAQSGAQLRLPDGTTMPFSAAMQLTHWNPQTSSGQAIPTPQRIDTSQQTEEERFVSKWAKDRGKTFSTLTSAEELQARKEFRLSGQLPPQPHQAAPGGVDAQFNDLVDLWKEGHPGQEPPAAVRTKLRAQANTVNDKPMVQPSTTLVDIQPGTALYRVADQLATGKMTFQQLRTLYAYSRDMATKLAIYDKAMAINPNFSPAQFEMGYKFATNPKVQQQMASINNVLSGVSDLVRASDAATRSGVTALNTWIVKGGVAMGGKKYSDFKTAVTAFADELSGALGYGGATDMSREMGFDMTNAALSPANFRSAVQDVVVPFVQRKKASLLGPMGPYGTIEMNPVAKEPVTLPTPPTGDTYRLVNGQWVKQPVR